MKINLESIYNTTKCLNKQPIHTRIKFVINPFQVLSDKLYGIPKVKIYGN